MATLYHTDKVGWYTPFYHLLFEHRRFEIKRVLEVGIGTKDCMSHVPEYLPGASLFMWRDYFPNAEIHGIDIEPSAYVSAERIYVLCGDSRTVTYGGSKFDLIVDDGSHNPQVQFQTFLNLVPILKDDGIYIIEDAEGWRDLSELLEGYSHQVVLSPHTGTLRSSGQAMGKLVVIRK
jgi:hypothetical protein